MIREDEESSRKTAPLTAHPFGNMMDGFGGSLGCRKAALFNFAIRDEVRVLHGLELGDVQLTSLSYNHIFDNEEAWEKGTMTIMNPHLRDRLQPSYFKAFKDVIDTTAHVDDVPFNEVSVQTASNLPQPPRNRLLSLVMSGDNHLHKPSTTHLLCESELKPVIYMDSGISPNSRISRACNNRNVQYCETYNFVDPFKVGFIRLEEAKRRIAAGAGVITMLSSQFCYKACLEEIYDKYGRVAADLFMPPWKDGAQFVRRIATEVGQVALYRPSPTWARSTPICDLECDPTPYYDAVVPAENTHTYMIGFRFPRTSINMTFRKIVDQSNAIIPRRFKEIPHWYLTSATPICDVDVNNVLCYKKKLGGWNGFSIFVTSTDGKNAYVHGRDITNTLHCEIHDRSAVEYYSSFSFCFEIIGKNAYLISVRVNGIKLSPVPHVMQAFVDKTFTRNGQAYFTNLIDFEVGEDLLTKGRYNILVDPAISKDNPYCADTDEGIMLVDFFGRETYIKSPGRRTIDINASTFSEVIGKLGTWYDYYNMEIDEELDAKFDREPDAIHEVLIDPCFVWAPIGVRTTRTDRIPVKFIYKSPGVVQIEGDDTNFSSEAEACKDFVTRLKLGAVYKRVKEVPVTIQGYLRVSYVKTRLNKKIPDGVEKVRKIMSAPFPNELPAIFHSSVNSVRTTLEVSPLNHL